MKNLIKLWPSLIVTFLIIFLFFWKKDKKIELINETFFEQTMLAKGDVDSITIVNEENAEIRVNPDSLALFRYYQNNKPIFTNPKASQGPQFVVSIPDVKFFLERVRQVQEKAGIAEDKIVNPTREDRVETFDYFNWIYFVIILIIFIIYFLPFIIARKKSFGKQVLILNLFLGWTFIGWVIALIWAVKEENQNN